MSRPLVVVGASGFGRETLDVVAAHNAARPDAAFEVVGVLDDGPSEANLTRLACRNIPYLGGIDHYLMTHEPVAYLLAIGAPKVREGLVARFDDAGWRAVSVVHPSASVGTMTVWLDGVVVCGGAQVSTNVHFGRHVHVNPNATIGHDSILESFVSINPAATISGDVHVRPRTLIGAGAIVLQGLSIGANTTVGAGAVVTKTVPDGVVVKGVPGVWS
jgi:sugar O-acyltransferase (sialic acid O-acetyltransferase NeuD family)